MLSIVQSLKNYLGLKDHLQYRFDKNYTKLEDKIISFFEKKYGKLSKSINLPLRNLDFVIYKDNKLFAGAEIKTLKETISSYSTWKSHHKALLENFHNIETLHPISQGFVAMIYGQLRNYSKKTGLNNLWLIQEGERFRKNINEALYFLRERNIVRKYRLYEYKYLLFYRINFRV